ncbi:4-hydroxy-tetrahydrodipicolinate reductase [Oscillibacter sp. GMB15532]|uniref:4-hydroxy-tetrahydrodipicolinate reductase n=1 Tax=Oscillibacter sp. GMB15532 TaxID=3230022 RepID=UPI0034DEA8A2
MKLVLIGHGKMGKLLEQRATELGHEVVAALDRENLAQLAALPGADMAVDFSRPETLGAVAAYVRRTGTPLLSGTTGYTPKEMEELRGLGSVAPVLHAANFSLGIAVFRRALAQVSDTLKPAFDIEIEETHHNQKADAPSGTAKLLLSAIDPNREYTPVYGREGNTGARNKKEIGVHALRGGTVAGTHTVSFFGPDEELSITHRAASRLIFVNGALHAAGLLAGRPAGFYVLEDLLFG